MRLKVCVRLSLAGESSQGYRRNVCAHTHIGTSNTLRKGFCVCCFETGSEYVALAVLELAM